MATPGKEVPVLTAPCPTMRLWYRDEDQRRLPLKECIQVIDVRELRKDPSAYRSRLSRKGADHLVDQLLEADAAWRGATAVAEALRSTLKLSGKPTPDQLQQLQRAKEQLQENGVWLSDSRSSGSGASARVDCRSTRDEGFRFAIRLSRRRPCTAGAGALQVRTRPPTGGEGAYPHAAASPRLKRRRCMAPASSRRTQ